MVAEMKYINENVKKDRLFLILLMFLPCLFVMLTNLDNDTWFILNHGKYVIENGIPHVEPFTIHQGFEFVMQQWLSASIFWMTYSSIGALGLKLLLMISYVLIILIIYKTCMKISNNFFISYSVGIATNVTIMMFMVTRPYIFSVLIFVIEIYLLESFIASNNKSYLYILPILSILLINLHGAMWPMIFVIIIPYIIDSLKFKVGFLCGQGYAKKFLLLSILGMILAGFINPYGMESMTYLFRSYGYAEINMMVDEMKPANINTVQGMMVFGSIFVVVFIYLIYRKGTTKLRYVLLTLGTAYLAISSLKGFLLFVICGLFPLTYYLKDFELPVRKNIVTKNTMLLRKVLIVIIMLLISTSIIVIAKNSGEINYNTKLLNDTIHFINEEKVPKVVLYTGYNDGGMAEFHGIPSYMDPRAEVFVKKNNKKDDVLKEYAGMQTGLIYYKDVLDKYRFTHLIVTEYDILYTYLKHDTDYKISYSNEIYTLFEHINVE